jgi:hypothetical protein
MTTDEQVVQNTQAWLERAVIGLNLCPFAKSVHVKGQVHYAVSHASDPAGLLEDLIFELNELVGLDAKVRDTTLLVAPDCLQDFLDFNDFLARADRALVKLGTLHLLREDSIDRAVAAFPNPESIFEVNMQTMERLGVEGWAALKVGRTPQDR